MIDSAAYEARKRELHARTAAGKRKHKSKYSQTDGDGFLCSTDLECWRSDKKAKNSGAPTPPKRGGYRHGQRGDRCTG